MIYLGGRRHLLPCAHLLQDRQEQEEASFGSPSAPASSPSPFGSTFGPTPTSLLQRGRHVRKGSEEPAAEARLDRRGHVARRRERDEVERARDGVTQELQGQIGSLGFDHRGKL